MTTFYSNYIRAIYPNFDIGAVDLRGLNIGAVDLRGLNIGVPEDLTL